MQKTGVINFGSVIHYLLSCALLKYLCKNWSIYLSDWPGGHYNPVKAGFCINPEDYYSSAKFYDTGIDDFGMLTHCDE